MKPYGKPITVAIGKLGGADATLIIVRAGTQPKELLVESIEWRLVGKVLRLITNNALRYPFTLYDTSDTVTHMAYQVLEEILTYPCLNQTSTVAAEEQAAIGDSDPDDAWYIIEI